MIRNGLARRMKLPEVDPTGVAMSENSEAISIGPRQLPLPPQDLDIDWRDSGELIVVGIAGRGPVRGPAVLFSAAGSILIVLGIVAVAKCWLRPSPDDIPVTAGVWSLAGVMWVLAIWRGRCRTTFEINQNTLRVALVVPLIGAIRVREFVRAAIRNIEVNRRLPRSLFEPPVSRLQIEERAGARHWYLTGYPQHGLKWIADVLSNSLGQTL